MQKVTKEEKAVEINVNQDEQETAGVHEKKYSRRTFITVNGKLIALGALSFFTMAKKMSAEDINAVIKMSDTDKGGECILCDNKCQLCDIMTGGGGCQVGCDSNIGPDTCSNNDVPCNNDQTCTSGNQFCKYEAE